MYVCMYVIVLLQRCIVLFVLAPSLLGVDVFVCTRVCVCCACLYVRVFVCIIL